MRVLQGIVMNMKASLELWIDGIRHDPSEIAFVHPASLPGGIPFFLTLSGGLARRIRTRLSLVRSTILTNVQRETLVNELARLGRNRRSRFPRFTVGSLDRIEIRGEGIRLFGTCRLPLQTTDYGSASFSTSVGVAPTVNSRTLSSKPGTWLGPIDSARNNLSFEV